MDRPEAVILCEHEVMGAGPRRVPLDAVDQILVPPVAADLPAAANRFFQGSADPPLLELSTESPLKLGKLSLTVASAKQ